MRSSAALRSTSCDVCERLILPGERVHVFRDPERGGRRRPICPLCSRRALERGWVRDGSDGPGQQASAA